MSNLKHLVAYAILSQCPTHETNWLPNHNLVSSSVIVLVKAHTFVTIQLLIKASFPIMSSFLKNIFSYLSIVSFHSTNSNSNFYSSESSPNTTLTNFYIFKTTSNANPSIPSNSNCPNGFKSSTINLSHTLLTNNHFSYPQ